MKNFDSILNHYKNIDPVIYQHMQNINFDDWFITWSEFRSKDLYISLCRSIVGQQLSTKAASAIFLRLKKYFDDNNVNLAPENVLNTSDDKLRELGLSGSKVKYIKDLSLNIANKKLDLQQMSNMDDEKVIIELTKVKGIGQWTAEMFLIFTLGRQNIFSHGDLGLKKGFEKIYNVVNPSQEYIDKIVAKWNPYKTYGSITLWNSLNS